MGGNAFFPHMNPSYTIAEQEFRMAESNNQKESIIRKN